MRYIGTRNKNITATASEAILKGICEDGGLFVPDNIPILDKNLSELVNLNYKELAYEIMKLYINDYTESEIKYCIDKAYDNKFNTDLITPIVKQSDNIFILELFHGKTLAFKDIALSILPYFMEIAIKKNNINKKILILTATSGDTGKAALEGFANIEGIDIVVFYPKYGVSEIQELQMVTQEGNNTYVVALKGNFDNAQNAVKDMFTDKNFIDEFYKNGYILSSANSINIGRLIPQIVYYFYSYMQMIKNNYISLGEKINFSVPTGNFGNILAGYYAKCMGLPINKLICASNDNKVLYDFFNSGIYNKNREFLNTISPSMDILISSNLERFVSQFLDYNKINEIMKSLSKYGNYVIDINNNDIIGQFAREDETLYAIKYLFEKTGYIMDTHTAVAYGSYQKYQLKNNDNTKTVIVSTASPYKFAKYVLYAINGNKEKYEKKSDVELIYELEKISNINIPENIKNILDKKVIHNDICEKDSLKYFMKSKFL